MKTALIGYTGFVGSNILRQFKFNDLYNSKNISEIENKKYDLIISAGISAIKWLANQKPEEDLYNIKKLLNYLTKVKANYFILISTVDVYPFPKNVDEDTPIEIDKAEPYGKNRFYAEEFIKKNFSNHSIVRLPGLFGEGLKKNFIFDIIHNQYDSFVNSESVFQFYNLNNIGKDLKIVLENKIPLVNFATEPISVQELSLFVLGKQINGNKEIKPVFYDMRTKYAKFFGKEGNYLYSKRTLLIEIKNFINQEKKKLNL